MKAPPFLYQRADTLDQVCELLHEFGDEAKLLAGGQSLMPALNMRLSSPRLLIDVNPVAGLSGIELSGDCIRIGALTRQVDIERCGLIEQYLPLLSRALPHIAHPAIRNRGTLGGSIALADPAAELPACALTLGARMVVRNSERQRIVPAEEFFLGLYETALAADEVLLALEFPAPKKSSRPLFLELSRRHGDYATVGMAGQIEISHGTINDIRLVFFAVADKPVLIKRAAQALAGCELRLANRAGAEDELTAELDPLEDLQANAEMKKHLARVLLRRALDELSRDAQT